jgi:hypothetical protein
MIFPRRRLLSLQYASDAAFANERRRRSAVGVPNLERSFSTSRSTDLISLLSIMVTAHMNCGATRRHNAVQTAMISPDWELLATWEQRKCERGA